MRPQYAGFVSCGDLDVLGGALDFSPNTYCQTIDAREEITLFIEIVQIVFRSDQPGLKDSAGMPSCITLKIPEMLLVFELYHSHFY